MKRDQIIARLQALAPDIMSMGVDGLYLFGSGARDQLHRDSDIDLFIDRRPGFDYRFTHLTGLKFLLEARLGRSVDVMTRTSLHPLLKTRIEHSAVKVF